jgi:VanZ family protein
MRLTPHTLMQGLRVGGIAAGVAAVVALAGPFRYEDLGLPFPDTVAHAILFYGVTLAMLTSLPRARANEVAMITLALGAMSEVVQALFGRQMSFQDFGGDAIGVTVAYAPVVITRLRELARTHPDHTFAEIRALDRRASRAIGRRPATERPAP